MISINRVLLFKINLRVKRLLRRHETGLRFRSTLLTSVIRDSRDLENLFWRILIEEKSFPY
jgi:hypothetical protein